VKCGIRTPERMRACCWQRHVSSPPVDKVGADSLHESKGNAFGSCW